MMDFSFFLLFVRDRNRYTVIPLHRDTVIPLYRYTVFSYSAVVEARTSYVASEASLGEVPDEFLDPVLCHLMRDPVLLPTSGTVMDR